MKKSKNSKTNFIIGISSLFLFSALISAYITIARHNDSLDSKQSSLGIRRIFKDVTVSAMIGEFRFTLTGFTSPGARVILEGLGISDETYANANGEFTFYNRFSPLSPREACLTAYDTDGRVSSPLCLPAFPTHKNVFIGPILLPPTVSLSDNIIEVNDYGTISGKGAPESDVEVQLYPDTSAQKLTLNTETDREGNYTLTIPTESPNSIRVFATNLFKNLFSDKSNTLTFDILPFWLLIVRRLLALFGLLRDYLIPLVLTFEALLLAWLVFIARKKDKHPLMVIQHHDIVKRVQSALKMKDKHEIIES